MSSLPAHHTGSPGAPVQSCQVQQGTEVQMFGSEVSAHRGDTIFHLHRFLEINEFRIKCPETPACWFTVRQDELISAAGGARVWDVLWVWGRTLRDPPGSGRDSRTEELSGMGQVRFAWGLKQRLCILTLGAHERVHCANVLPGGVFVDAGEGPIQLIMGDCSY